MNHNERDKDIVDNITVQESRPQGETPLPPWLFRHSELIQAISSADRVDKKKLINILNYLHFNADPVYVLLKHPQYSDEILVKVRHDPCLGDRLTVHWDQTYGAYNLERYRLQYLVISHDQSVILAPLKLLAAENDHVTIQLPETGLVISERRISRFRCHGVKVDLWQSGFHAQGDLIDFNHRALRIIVASDPSASFSWFNVNAPVTVRLFDRNEFFYAGDCTCLYQEQTGKRREIVIAPKQECIQRFQSKRYRTPRRRSIPPIYAIFEHPFTKKTVQREIFNISTSGFSICETNGESILVPGLIIPNMIMSYAGVLKIHCKAQVVYRKEEDDLVRFGLVILDIDLTNYKILSQILNSINGEEASTSNEVDLDALWEFFFDADFIYPGKYKFLHEMKDEFKAVYRKLYRESPEIAHHFVYQKKGRIYGHIAMLRAYNRTWMVHHHAARPLGGRPIGVLVLKELILYVNDLYRVPSANFDYVITYYRPENKFPDRIFGGFAETLANPQHCALDNFSYINCPIAPTTGELPAGWTLRPCSTSDLWEFERFYRNRFGGLFWAIVKPDEPQHGVSTEEAYTASGFIRKWQLFILAYRDNPQAFIVGEESDVGINLSNLLNGFKVFVMNPGLPSEILFAALSRQIKNSGTTSVALMICPKEYTEEIRICYEKKEYLLWILNMHYAHEFYAFLERKYRIRVF